MKRMTQKELRAELKARKREDAAKLSWELSHAHRTTLIERETNMKHLLKMIGTYSGTRGRYTYWTLPLGFVVRRQNPKPSKPKYIPEEEGE